MLTSNSSPTDKQPLLDDNWQGNGQACHTKAEVSIALLLLLLRGWTCSAHLHGLHTAVAWVGPEVWLSGSGARVAITASMAEQFGPKSTALSRNDRS